MANTNVNKASKATQAFMEYLHIHGLRLTQERLSIVEVVSKQASLFSVDDLHTIMVREAFPVSVATLYNTLDLLVRANVVSCVRLPERQSALYRLDIADQPHVYLVCRGCGSVKEVAAKPLARLIDRHSFSAFTPASFALSVYGFCKKCKKSNNHQ